MFRLNFSFRIWWNPVAFWRHIVHQAALRHIAEVNTRLKAGLLIRDEYENVADGYEFPRARERIEKAVVPTHRVVLDDGVYTTRD